MNYYYFAYGSNLLKDRLEYRVGNVKKIGNYTLKGWRLVFNCGYYEKFANVKQTYINSDVVEGVLYDLNERQIKLLDRCEGFYQRRLLKINNSTSIYFYVAYPETVNNDKEVKPRLYYLNIILDGCLENGMIYTYDKILSFKLKNYSLKGSRHKRL